MCVCAVCTGACLASHCAASEWCDVQRGAEARLPLAHTPASICAPNDHMSTLATCCAHMREAVNVTLTYVCVHMYVPAYPHRPMHPQAYPPTHTNSYTKAHTDTHTYARADMQAHAHTHTQTQAHANTQNIHRHAHARTRTCAGALPPPATAAAAQLLSLAHGPWCAMQGQELLALLICLPDKGRQQAE